MFHSFVDFKKKINHFHFFVIGRIVAQRWQWWLHFLRAHHTVILPGLRNLILLELAQRAGVSNAARQVGAHDLLGKADAADLVLPV